MVVSYPSAEAFMEISDIAALYDSEFETHLITTEDGYINTIFRIRNLKAQENKAPAAAMLFHGFIDSADSFCIKGREKSPAFILADAGYDVWIVNTRGNKHSRGHTNLNSSVDVEYWKNAMVHHIGKYDVPSFIETIKSISKVDNMTVVAHSQGTSLLFNNFAQNQSYYKESINVLIALGPLGKITSTSPINTFLIYFFTDYLEFFLKLGYFHAFDSLNPFSIISSQSCLYLQTPC